MPLLSTTVILSLVALATSCRNAQLLRRGITTEEQKKGIVELHNALRNSVASGIVKTQPPAQNMREMRWDDELAQLAQKWADNCVFEHEKNVKIKKGGTAGQNLALFRTTAKDKLDAPDFDNMINGWFNEVYEFGYNGTFNYNSGHYSQVIWGNTVKVGCGYSGYFSKYLYHNYLVCYYFPAGNVEKTLPYEYGRLACEDNELFRSRRYSHLCTIDKNIINSCYISGKTDGPSTMKGNDYYDYFTTTENVDVTTTFG